MELYSLPEWPKSRISRSRARFSSLIRCLFRVGKEAVEALISTSENGSVLRGMQVFSRNSTTKIVALFGVLRKDGFGGAFTSEVGAFRQREPPRTNRNFPESARRWPHLKNFDYGEKRNEPQRSRASRENRYRFALCHGAIQRYGTHPISDDVRAVEAVVGSAHPIILACNYVISPL